MFVCALQDERISLASLSGNCKYSVTLESKFACHIQSKVVDKSGSCSLVDPSNGVTYSFLPLKAANNSYYTVNYGTSSFKVDLV